MKAQGLLIGAIIIFSGACKPIAPENAPETNHIAKIPSSAPTTTHTETSPMTPTTPDAAPVVSTIADTPKAPDLMAPSRKGAEITFSWSKPSVVPGGADIVSYNLQIASPGVNSADPVILFSGNLTGLSKTVTGVNGQGYFAKVQAVDANGKSSEFSAASQRVIVDTESPGEPTGLRVITQIGQIDVLVTLIWEASLDNVTAAPEMTYYACSSSTVADISTLAACQNLTTGAELPSVRGRAPIQLRKPLAEAGGTMYFRVIAQDEAGNTSLSQILSAQVVTPTISPAD